MGFDSGEIVNKVEKSSKDIDSCSEETFDQTCKRHVCPQENCSASFNRRWRLECHMRKHSGERPFVCLHDDCNKSYTSSSHLKRHMQKVHQPTVDSFLMCSYEKCEKKFKTQAALNMHIKNIHVKRKYVCKTCSKPFRKHQHLKVHEYEHTGIKPFPCTHPGCEKSFVVPSKLKRHAKIHAGYKCDSPSCPAIFRTWTLLRRHMKACHPPRYTCDTCKRTFNSRYNLQAHLKIHAEEKKTFQCPFDNCPRFYFHERNLRLHIRSFHEECQFHCNVEGCKARFAHKVSLKKHIEHHNNNTLPIKKNKQRKPKEEKRPKRQKKEDPSLPYLGPEPAAFLSGFNKNTFEDGSNHHLDLQNMSTTTTDTSEDEHPLQGNHVRREHEQQNIENVRYNNHNMEKASLPSDKSANVGSISDCAQGNSPAPNCNLHNLQCMQSHLPICSKENMEVIRNDYSKYSE